MRGAMYCVAVSIRWGADVKSSSSSAVAGLSVSVWTPLVPPGPVKPGQIHMCVQRSPAGCIWKETGITGQDKVFCSGTRCPLLPVYRAAAEGLPLC
ncbi:hypothetical protein EYF80_004855 [Liparis tanakae]|uniref:Uncharacterized protein n=1 Tax=Liparis tanakae TaxID=230148 RepID=A0A4Z2J3N2_9TELE|nr:hypothetical protein EYF80_004855 [Liparis tanakae]